MIGVCYSMLEFCRLLCNVCPLLFGVECWLVRCSVLVVWCLHVVCRLRISLCVVLVFVVCCLLVYVGFVFCLQIVDCCLFVCCLWFVANC